MAMRPAATRRVPVGIAGLQNQFVAVAVEDQLRKAGLKVQVRLEAA